MSKQSQANAIVAQGKSCGLDRQTMLEEICAQTGCAGGYAATLFAKAVKEANQTVQTVAAKPQAPKAKPDGKMAKFTNGNLDKIRAEVQAALDVISAAHGITLKMKNIRYEGDRLSFSSGMEANIGSKADKQKNNWDKYCEMYGAKKSDYGRQFKTRFGNCTIIGISPRAKKYPINAKAPDGKEYGFTTEVLEKLL